jgi:subtilisin family serine protease
LDNIIAVAATYLPTGQSDDVLVGFSNYGATTVGLGAPGNNIYSCWNGSDSVYY